MKPESKYQETDFPTNSNIRGIDQPADLPTSGSNTGIRVESNKNSSHIIPVSTNTSTKSNRIYLCCFKPSNNFTKLGKCPRAKWCLSCKIGRILQQSLKKIRRMVNNKYIDTDTVSKRTKTYNEANKEDIIYYYSLKSLKKFLFDKLKTNNQTMNLIYTAPKDNTTVSVYRCKSYTDSQYQCKAFIRVEENNDKRIKVTYYFCHNHNINVNKMAFPSKEIEIIKDKLLLGISKDRIFKDLQPTVNIDFSKSNLFSKNYIRTIEHGLSLDYDEKDDFNDFLKFVSQKSNSKEIIPLTENSQIVSRIGIKGKDVFRFGFTTQEGLTNFEQYGGKGVHLDTTHSTNRYKFYLTVGLVVDNIQKSFPFVYILSSSEQKEAIAPVFQQLYTVLVNRTPPNFVITDMATNLINAWYISFPQNTRNIWCFFHFLKSIRKRIDNTIKNKEIRYKTHNMIENFKNLSTTKAFDTAYNQFLFFIDNNSKEFSEYFKKNYSQNLVFWDLTRRKGSHSNTNNYSESFFRVLKNVYLKKNVRLDIKSLIEKVLQQSQDMAIETKKVETTRKYISYRIRQSHKNRENAIKIQSKLVFKKLEENRYKCGEHEITLATTECIYGCLPMCKTNPICHHLAECSCYTSFFKREICMHIHGLFMTRNAQIKEHDKTGIKSYKIISDRMNTLDKKVKSNLMYVDQLKKEKDPGFLREQITKECETICNTISHLDNEEELVSILRSCMSISRSIRTLKAGNFLNSSEITHKRRHGIPQRYAIKNIVTKDNNNEKIDLTRLKTTKRGRKGKDEKMPYCHFCFSYNDKIKSLDIDWISCDSCHFWFHEKCATERGIYPINNIFECGCLD